MTLFRSLGTLGHIHILRIEGQNEDFSLTGWILTPPSRVDIEGSANYNEICAMTWRVRWHPWLMGDLASSVFPGCVYFPVSPCSVHCGLFPSRSGIVFSSLTTWKMNVSQPRQDSKGRTGAVIKKWRACGRACLCASVASVVCLATGAPTPLQCFMALHKNKWCLSGFNYNGEYAKAPRSLVCFCSASGGSGFGVFSIWLLS